jgi:polyisoprenoid-binding protein YceI
MLQRSILILATLLITLAPIASAEVIEWKLDPVHSNVGFKVRHFMVSWIRGEFDETDAIISVDKDDLSTLTMTVNINPASVNTGVQRRDDHLRNPDFFEVETYKTMRFVSTSAKPQPDGTVKVTGDLTMHGVTNEVTLDVAGLTTIVDPGSGPRTGAFATGVLKRSDYGMTFTEIIEAGGITIGDEIYIEIDAELRPTK